MLGKKRGGAQSRLTRMVDIFNEPGEATRSEVCLVPVYGSIHICARLEYAKKALLCLIANWQQKTQGSLL